MSGDGSSPAKALLAELKKGQHALWKTIENLKPSEERMAKTQTALREEDDDSSIARAVGRVDLECTDLDLCKRSV